IAVLRQSIRLAFVAALQHLPPRQRAALLLMEVVGLSANETADTLEMSAAAVNSALQRARTTLQEKDTQGPADPLSAEQRDLVDKYVDAFERYDIDSLVVLFREDATLSMPPYDLWLQGHEKIRAWLLGPGAECKGSRLVRTAASGSPAFGQYRVDPSGGHKAWALVVLEVAGGKVLGLNSFLDVETLFPLFGLPLHLGSRT
ncbi:MAG: RNA polymerase subunit sigma-70, partial [Polyangiaceae bacterium]